ncbi:MAG: lamin tail domain-containing protein [Chloroflexi bacterium]|nr:lamin tail domain-containing protein [Chloroflexota bacterium]
MDRRRLIFYLLLNIFVSACVTISILYWYDRNYREVTLPQPQAIQPTAAPASSNATAVSTIQGGAIQIFSVSGAGTLDAEVVIVKYTGDGELDLTGWHLKDSNGNVYTFPSFKLFKNGAVQVHTKSGTNTAIDLYWGQNNAVWQSGENVELTDANGNVQYSYHVP